MFEESASIPSIWTSVNNWFTPTVLFVLLNVMIGTILFSSSLAHPQEQKKETHEDLNQHQNQENHPKLGRPPSVLQRLRSINFQSFRSQEPQESTTRLKQTLAVDIHHSQHQQDQQTLESETHYLFQQSHQENTLESKTRFLFEQIHQQQTLDLDTSYSYDQTHQGNTQESEALYLYGETHLEKPQESEGVYLFQQQKVGEIDSSVFQETEDQYFDEQMIEQNEEEDGVPQTLDEVYSQLTVHHHVNRTKSDTVPASGEVPVKLPAKMRKSASMKSPFGHFEEGDVVETESRRPATVREMRTKVSSDGDHEVDAKADDFINKFKHQLKLQRLDSIIRYKEVINRGNGK